MKFAIPVPLAVLLFGSTLFGQSANSPTRPQTFHARGEIKDPLAGAIPGVKVTFQSELVTTTVITTVTTNNVGVYEADLPLGDYTMTAQGPPGFRFYRRPLFRVTSPLNTVMNVTLLVGSRCGDVVGTGEQVEAGKEYCKGEALIRDPSGDG